MYYISPNATSTGLSSGQQIFATLQSRTGVICNNPPILYGSWLEDRFNSVLYVCISSGDSFYGSFNNGGSNFTDTLSGSTATGNVIESDGTFNFN